MAILAKFAFVSYGFEIAFLLIVVVVKHGLYILLYNVCDVIVKQFSNLHFWSILSTFGHIV